MFAFVQIINQNDYIANIENSIAMEENEFNILIKYFKKNWQNSQFLKFQYEKDGVITRRTNNACEVFHFQINQKFEYRHSKIAILIDISKFNYEKLAVSLAKINKNEEKRVYLLDDIQKFIKNYYRTTKKKLSFQEIFDCQNFKDYIEEICSKFLENVFGMTSEDNSLSNNNIIDIEGGEELEKGEFASSTSSFSSESEEENEIEDELILDKFNVETIPKNRKETTIFREIYSSLEESAKKQRKK